MLKENEVEPAEPLQSLEFFALNTEEEPAFVAVTPRQIEIAACDPQPVEFQGHQVKGSAAGAVMLRGPSSPWGHSLFPGNVQGESHIARAWLLAPQAPGTDVQADFLQFPNEDYFPKGSTSFNIEDSYRAVIESEKDSFENDLMEKSSFLENRNLAELPLVGGTQAPLTALPPAADPPGFALRPHPTPWDGQEASGFPLPGLQEDSALPASGFGNRGTGFPQASRAASPRAASRRLHREAAASKWLKYQNLTQGGTERDPVDGACTKHVRGPGPRPQDALHAGPADSERLQRIKDMLGPQQQACGSQDPGSGSKAFPEVNGSELCFPSGQKTKSAYLPQRHVHIPAVFQSPAQYKQIFTSCLIEHLNIMLFGLAQRLHRALAKVDISFYTSPKGEEPKGPGKSVPSCHHQQPAKLVMVKKDGPNKGRLFYACDGPKADQCKFFKWFEAVTPGNLLPGESPPVKVLSDIKSIGLYLRSQKIPVYEECQLLLRKGFDFQRKQYGKLKKFAPMNSEFCNDEPKSKLYLKLSRKESSSTYSKDDLWVVSKTLDFELDTFIACSAFFGPSSVSEVELLPLKGYFPSNWPTNTVVHALLVCNASTELTTLKNIQDHFNPATLPLTQSLLTMSSSTPATSKPVSTRKFTPPAFSGVRPRPELPGLGATMRLASELAQAHGLNQDQAAALNQIARMMAPQPIPDDTAPRGPARPITIIHGVFGAGKSYLLALVVLFFVQLFEQSETAPLGDARPWKVLISSSTNVAVDRVLLGLLSLGFEKFVRVGSIRKIAKPILPYSLHAGSESDSEQLQELQALLRADLSPAERVYVRRSLEQHKLGTNRKLLRQVRVVGVTCAACPFPCLNDLKFPVVVLDECSQITEPASLLPIARFECEKLILVGDPKQLPPTIQGSDAAHENGLEQTLFDRLCLMGHEPVLLRTQYRCHPAISAIVNDLFYEGRLLDGVSAAERGPLLAWLPTLCFYNVRGLEQMEGDNSFHNVAEAAFTLKLIQALLAGGVAGSVIGVITLYKSQMYKLCQALSASDVDHPDLRAVQVSTVDAFQGAEKEVIILSCVRTRNVGFIDSGRRMNVALTRGRRHLLIVGSLACLRENRLWGRVIQHCQGRDGGLQHASQLEPQLDRLLQAYLEEQAAAKERRKGRRET
ncbi:protein ZGRF1 [Sorex araneus]|uniref:protein ZGRF1 n=1 Tax=Sorex araneus TaxID=42254 RepID=UPI002433F45D|nr:protein ZGRF1 [Sorex araneus]